MLPIDPKEKIAFTPPHLWSEEAPEKPKPVIWLRPMSIVDRARWQAALTAIGARAVTDTEMAAARLPVLQALDCSDAECEAIQALYELAEAARNEGRPLDKADQVSLMKVERMIVQADEHYRLLAETRALYLEVAPILALKQQCFGWQNLPRRDGTGTAAFRRENGAVAEDALQLLDPVTLLLAGFRAIGLSSVSETDAKKSA
ncbi:MAG: hypothetical protein AB7R90_19465 [Reyranellaceae bacterium]